MIKRPTPSCRNTRLAFCQSGANDSGFGLISLLIAIGVMGMIMAGVMESLQNNLKAQKKFEELSDMVELRRVLRSRIDCARTKAANPGTWNICDDLLKIKAVDVANNVVISDTSPATTMGAYAVEARCAQSGASGNLKIKMIKKAGSVQVTNDLFKKVPIICN